MADGPRIIGGLFGLADPAPDPVPRSAPSPPFPTDARTTFLATARAGLRLFVQETAPRKVWLPSYLCPVVLDALGDLECTVEFYGLDAALRASDPMPDLAPGDLVIVLAPFGRRPDSEVSVAARQRGARVLVDASQALLTSVVAEHADAVVYSPRKFVGVPEGGVLVRREPPASAPRFDDAPAAWRRDQLAAAVLRRDFDLRGGADDDRRWYEHFQRAEDAPVGVFAMGEMTRAMLLGSFDWSAIAARRVRNHAALQEALGGRSLLGPPAMGEVPLGFLARFEDQAERDRARSALIAAGIYPPVHWDLAGRVPERFAASHDLSRRALTLPCDQRYDAADMARIVAVVEDAVSR